MKPAVALRRAAMFMVLYAITQSVVWGIVRDLSQDLSTSTLFFFRNIVGVVVLIPMLVKSRNDILQSKHLGAHISRAGAAFIGGLSIFYALKIAPIATVVAITYSAPIFATAITIALLGETFTKEKLIALLLGGIGVIMITRPDQGIGFIGIGAALTAALMTAVAFVMVKHLSSVEKPAVIVVYPYILILPLSLAVAAVNWTSPALSHIPLLLVMGVGVVIGQYFMVQAFANVEASSVLPLDFIRLVAAVVIGVYVFNEQIDIWVFVGGCVILVGSFLLLKAKSG